MVVYIDTSKIYVALLFVSVFFSFWSLNKQPMMFEHINIMETISQLILLGYNFINYVKSTTQVDYFVNMISIALNICNLCFTLYSIWKIMRVTLVNILESFGSIKVHSETSVEMK